MKTLQAAVAYVLWGIFPVYWKMLGSVDPSAVICHRILWSLLTLAVCVQLFRQWSDIRGAVRDFRRLGLSVVAALLISTNWLVFIWAVQHGAVVESSLGYFINPLLNVLLGVLLFSERLSKMQWLAVIVAAVGLCIMTVSSGRVSWIALTLASTFAFYAVVKKKTSLPAVAGLGLETAVLAIPALGFLAWHHTTTGQWESPGMLALLVLAGPITTLPLVLFASAAKSVPLVSMGLLQYIAPSLQFIIGIALYKEPVDAWKLTGFLCVWLALAILSAHAVSIARARSRSDSALKSV
ncbi:MAG: EamA family transporter RarD [Pirellulales bacterium]